MPRPILTFSYVYKRYSYMAGDVQETYQDHYFTTQAMDTGVMLDKQALTSKMCVRFDFELVIRNYKLTSTQQSRLSNFS